MACPREFRFRWQATESLVEINRAKTVDSGFAYATATVAAVKPTAGIAAIAIILFTTSFAEEPPILAANFDLSLTVGDAHYTARNNAMVRSGNVIPIELGNFKVGLKVSEGPAGRFTIQLPVFEKTDNAWYQINQPAPEFDGDLGAPTEITWESVDLKLDLAIIVGLTIR